MAAAKWEFWIDVGGTFGSSRDVVVDEARCSESPAFWIGWRLTIVNATGAEIGQANVVGYGEVAGTFSLSRLAKDPPGGGGFGKTE
jgi:hypothetical protein